VFWLIFAITLGLMPYSPEPHVWEKLKWILSGANDMRAIDWIDFILHATPWIGFIATSIRKAVKS